MKSWKVEAAIIAVGLLLLGIMVKGGINNFVNKDRVVSVKGLAEMEVPADKVVWPLVYKDIGNEDVYKRQTVAVDEMAEEAVFLDGGKILFRNF